MGAASAAVCGGHSGSEQPFSLGSCMPSVLGAMHRESVGALHFRKEEGLCRSPLRLLERLRCTSWLAHRQRLGKKKKYKGQNWILLGSTLQGHAS